MKAFIFRSMVAVVLAGASAAAGGEPTAHFRLDAQLWARPLGVEGKLKFRRLGPGAHLEKTLPPSTRIVRATARVDGGEIYATVTFTRIPAAAEASSYLATEARVYDATTGGLLAECANYDSLAEASPGVGVCSGTKGAEQFGLSLSRAAEARK